MSYLTVADLEGEGLTLTTWDYLVLRAAQRQYWLWIGLSQPRHWAEDPRHTALARVRVAMGLDAEVSP